VMGHHNIPDFDSYRDIIKRNFDAFSNGVNFPDWGYSCVMEFLGDHYAGDGAEAAHWNPYVNASLHYINETFTRPWNKEAEQLIAFTMGVVSHSASDTLWHNLATVGGEVHAGLINTLGHTDFQGSYGKAHSAADWGGEPQVTFDTGRRAPDSWYLPSFHVAKIYERMGFSDSVSKPILDLCNQQEYGEYLAAAHAQLSIFQLAVSKDAPFLTERYHDWWMGGIGDMVLWTNRCWRGTVESLHSGNFTPCAIAVRADDTMHRARKPNGTTSGNKTHEFPPGYDNSTDHKGQHLKPKPKPTRPIETTSSTIESTVPEPTRLVPAETRPAKYESEPEIVQQMMIHDGCGDLNSSHNSIVYFSPYPFSELGSGIATGDFDGDGKIELALGAPGYNSDNSIQSGAVFVVNDAQYRIPGRFRRDVSKMAKTVVLGKEEGGRFGEALTALDFNLDGISDLVVSSPSAGSANMTYSGQVHVYLGGRGGLDLQRPIVISPHYSTTQMGSKLFTGDIDGDGHSDLMIGAPYATLWPFLSTGNMRQSGQLWIYLSTSSRVSGQRLGPRDTDWLMNGPDVWGWFGYHAVVTTVENQRLLLVGSPNYAPSNVARTLITPTRGKISAFDITDWPKRSKLWTLVGRQEDLSSKFGWAFEVGTLLGPSTPPMLIVSAPTANDGHEPQVGKVWSIPIRGLEGTFTVPERARQLQLQGYSQPGARFGWTMGLADFDGDNVKDLWVSQPWRYASLYDDVNNGGAYIWLSGPQLRKRTWSPDFCAFSQFKQSRFGKFGGAADLDDDGKSDLILSGVESEDRKGAVVVIFEAIKVL